MLRLVVLLPFICVTLGVPFDHNSNLFERGIANKLVEKLTGARDANPAAKGAVIGAASTRITAAFVCGNTLLPNRCCFVTNAICAYLTPDVNGISTGTPPVADLFAYTCNGVNSGTVHNPNCIYLTTPTDTVPPVYQGFPTADLQYQCGEMTTGAYNPACTYSTAPVNNIITGTVGATVPSYTFVCNGQTTATYNAACEYGPGVDGVFTGGNELVTTGRCAILYRDFNFAGTAVPLTSGFSADLAAADQGQVKSAIVTAGCKLTTYSWTGFQGAAIEYPTFPPSDGFFNFRSSCGSVKCTCV